MFSSLSPPHAQYTIERVECGWRWTTHRCAQGTHSSSIAERRFLLSVVYLPEYSHIVLFTKQSCSGGQFARMGFRRNRWNDFWWIIDGSKSRHFGQYLFWRCVYTHHTPECTSRLDGVASGSLLICPFGECNWCSAWVLSYSSKFRRIEKKLIEIRKKWKINSGNCISVNTLFCWYMKRSMGLDFWDLILLKIWGNHPQLYWHKLFDQGAQIGWVFCWENSNLNFNGLYCHIKLKIFFMGKNLRNTTMYASEVLPDKIGKMRLYNK